MVDCVSLLYCYLCTLPTHLCVCQQAPDIELPAPCTLLFHPREYSKHSNTGRLVKMASNANTATWHRLKNTQQAQQFAGYVLLYPTETLSTPQMSETIETPKGFLIIDATWQESRKMLRQSPWLAQLPRMGLAAAQSQYQLRRNQNTQGLSTIETVSHWLITYNRMKSAEEMLHFFQNFQSAYQQAQQAGLLK